MKQSTVTKTKQNRKNRNVQALALFSEIRGRTPILPLKKLNFCYLAKVRHIRKIV